MREKLKTILLTAVLAVLYPLAILPAGLLAGLLKRDALLLRRPNTTSYWIQKASLTDVQSYFSQEHSRRIRSAAPSGTSRWMLPIYLGLARLFAPRRRSTVETATSAARREQGIPDEIYTLW